MNSLIKPYVLHNVLCGALVTFVVGLFGFSWSSVDSAYDFVKSMLSWGTPFDITSASWFIVTLFFVNVTYACVALLFRNNSRICRLIGMQVILLLTGLCALYYQREFSVSSSLVLLLKTAFMLPFFHFGIVFRELIEKRGNSYIFMGGGFFVSVILSIVYQNQDLVFNSIAFFGSFSRTAPVYLPYLTSVSSILFYYGLASFLESLFSKNVFVNYLSENTIYVLTLHLLFFNVLNVLLAYVFCVDNFNHEAFYKSAWYVYAPTSGYLFLYLLFGVLGPLVLRYVIGKVCKSINDMKSLS